MCDASPTHPFFDAHTPESPSETDKIDALPIIVRREQSLEMTRETWDYMMRVNPHVSHVPVHLCFVCPTDEEKRFINLDLFSLFDFVVLCKNHKNDVCVRSHVVFLCYEKLTFLCKFLSAVGGEWEWVSARQRKLQKRIKWCSICQVTVRVEIKQFSWFSLPNLSRVWAFHWSVSVDTEKLLNNSITKFLDIFHFVFHKWEIVIIHICTLTQCFLAD